MNFVDLFERIMYNIDWILIVIEMTDKIKVIKS